jgi:tetratricopeptide (TPR) repeat protein
VGIDMDRSITKLEAELAANPNDVKLLTEIAAVYEFELEDYAKAKQYYEKVLAINPEHVLALDALDVLNDKNIHPNL